MDQKLKRALLYTGDFGVFYDALRSRVPLLRDVVNPVIQRKHDIALVLENYLIYSTVLCAFLGVHWFHKGIDIFWGYPILVINAGILLLLNRLLAHRIHAILIGVVTLVSLVASRRSGTPSSAIIAQILGVVLFSSYYLSMLTVYRVSLPRWITIYSQIAWGIAVWGIIDFIARKVGLFPETITQPRLHSIFDEPSFFVYLTLPAIGIYLWAHRRKGGYFLELGTFLVSYILADSGLGFLGLFLALLFAYRPRLSFWRILAFAGAMAGMVVAVFLLSANFRLRVIDTALGIALLNFQHVNASTYAILSNAYVALRTFIKYPIIGVGIGGYPFQYTQYLPFLGNDDPLVLTLNMNDAASLFFRTAAELGIFGLVGLIGFLALCARVKGDGYVAIRNALIPFFVIRMGRYGAYFSMELYFFVGLYLLNYLHYRASLHRRPAPLPPAELHPAPA